MVVLAVMAAGVHTMSIAAPALAEQERLARTADAAAERAVVPNPAAADGIPVPALLGGIVIAFAVGLSAGQVQRRRRAARRAAIAQARRAPAPTPSVPARPAPPPPEPVAPEPKPVELEVPDPPAPPPPPPPTPVRSHGPRILRVRTAPTPPPPEPPAVEEPAAEVAGEPVEDEPVAPRRADDQGVEPRPVAEGTEAPAKALGGAPERPRRDDAPPPAPDVPATPVAETPEALRRSPASEPEPVVPARRFARARPWPKEAETLWTCEIAWKAGYLKSTFRAMAGPPGAGRRKAIAESPSLRWTLMTDPEPPTPEMIASIKVLVSALVAAGWEHTGSGAAWYARRFVWRGSGEPGAVSVPDEVESAERPPR
jgi:hypothetical protein